MSSRHAARALLVALAALAVSTSRGGAQDEAAPGAARAPAIPFVTSFAEAYDGLFELLDVRRSTLRASSDLDARPRSERVVLVRMRALGEGCVRLSARTLDGARTRTIVVNVLPRDAAIAVPRSASASERLRVSVGDEVLWPLPDVADATFLPRGRCDDDDPDMRLLLAGELPGRACTLQGAVPRAWRAPALLEAVAQRCHFTSRARGVVATTVERFSRIRRAGRVQGDLTALAAGSARSLLATHGVEQERGRSPAAITIAYVPSRRVVRAGDWVFERRDDADALEGDLLACLHERDSACRVRPRGR